MKKQYVIGVDFGTLSGRALLLNAVTGEELGESVMEYPHGVMDTALPDGTPLPPFYALQHPKDYVEVLSATVRDVVRKSGIEPHEVAGMGIDFTTCTILPVNEAWEPLCNLPEYEKRRHAYVKLWKHHAAQPLADEITALAGMRGEAWLPRYGGKVSCEWMIPKILEILREDPEIYHASARFIEAADWLSVLLTGEESHSSAFAGFKAMWDEEKGYPSDAFFTALDPALHGIVGTKLSEKMRDVTQIAGKLNARGAEMTGLPQGVPLSIPMLDAHAALPALNIMKPGEMLLILGTSSVLIAHDEQKREINGICGYVKNGPAPGYYTYEAGQAGCGDVFDWFVRTGVPASYEREAEARGIGVHALLREKAETLRPGESGLIALDWVSGNRSVLANYGLSGMLLGMNLQTKPEEIYRAWIEGTAFGLRMIMEQYEAGGMRIGSICAAGGIAKKDRMLMQIYADVTGRSIRVAETAQAGARGSAIYAAYAGGIYGTVAEAAERLSVGNAGEYRPIEENRKIYEELFREYTTLHDYFGRGGNRVMERMNLYRK